MPTQFASLRLDSRGLAAAAALAVSAFTLTAAVGPAWAQPAPAWTQDADAADRFSYVLFSSGDSSSTINGSSGDYQRAKALRTAGQPLLYFRHDGAAYVIRDPALLRRAQEMFEPQRVLGQRQSALGRQQSALGRQQGALGREQGRLGSMMANSTPRQMHELGRQMRELGERQKELGQRQAALGQQQGALGREQGRLGRIANANLRSLVSEALQRGLAQRVS